MSYDDDDMPPPRRRQNLMDRRLRRARGDDDPDEYDGPYDSPYDDDDDGAGYDTYLPPPRRGYRRGAPVAANNGCAQGALVLTIGGLAALLIAALFFNRAMSGVTNLFSGVAPTVQAMMASPTTTLRLNSAAVVRRVQQLNRLETTSYTIEKVIEAGVEGNVLYDLLYADKLLLIAHGTVIAGVDLSKLTEQDITISDDGHSLTVRLPPVQILSSTLDNQKTRIYRRDQALFADNPGLETQARQAAEDQILKAACEDNILLKASQESQKALQQLFSLAEFDQVSVVAAPPGPCVAPADAGAPAP